jgi:outer membrane protein OmpA-like peptidoglycan-associated protein
MKFIYTLTEKIQAQLRSGNVLIKCIILLIYIYTGIQTPLHAQVATYTKPLWWFGAAAGGNINFYGGSTQKLNADLTAPVPFHQGTGLGLYVSPLVEYYRPNGRFGFTFQAGYDSRKGMFKEVFSPCNCPRDLSTKLSYLTIEPNLRFAPLKSNLYFFGGPRVAFNLSKSFTYQQKTNPDYPLQIEEPAVKGNLSDVNKTLISMQVGIGYDIGLSSPDKSIQYILSPFVSYQPYFGQSPRSIETWTMNTLRIGAALKLGRGKKTLTPAAATIVTPTTIPPLDRQDTIYFTVNAPKNIPSERRVRETFPIRNYIFFNVGSTNIPDRYILLRKDEVNDFKEDQLEVTTPKNLSGRSSRQMTVYYNILNILGDRLSKNPTATIKLVGSSEKGLEDGQAMSESVKDYLVRIFGINPNRIATEGRIKPTIPSEQPGSTKELDLLREGDQRVTIESTSPALLMEFQSGPEASLKPVKFAAIQEAPIESYISINTDMEKNDFANWSLKITDQDKKVKNFGPYTRNNISIPGKSILGTRSEGLYKVTIIGKTNSGNTLTKDTTVRMRLWKSSVNEEGIRYSVIFEINSAEGNAIYEKYLTEIVTPKIPKNATVVIHGYTDIIGDENYNIKLSLARANGVKNIIENALIKSGRKDVKLEVYGFGEDETLSQFDNNFPEERFYNRTVIIDILPVK